MSILRVHSVQPSLYNPTLVTIETDISRGLHAFSLVGLASKATDESKDRVGSAIKNSGYTSPKSQNQKIVVSLAPADIKKEGPIFDLGIAISYLLASQQIKPIVDGFCFLGELSLSGEIKPIVGIYTALQTAIESKMHTIFIPKTHEHEAVLLADSIHIISVSHLHDVIEHLEGRFVLSPLKYSDMSYSAQKNSIHDFAYISGQKMAKRALLIAATGGHNVLLYGPPGTGKTMLAQAFAEILPPLTFEEMLEVAHIHSSVYKDWKISRERPVRSPHHTSSHVSLVGGGQNISPGEVTLAHRGVLFLDEFPHYSSQSLESLREPLEEGYIRISRARGNAKYPARFILIAAMNPCPCGYIGIQNKCTCSPQVISKYQSKISGPILDRIDIGSNVQRIHVSHLNKEVIEESSDSIKNHVIEAIEFRKNRGQLKQNSELSSHELFTYLEMNDRDKKDFDTISEKMNLSPRSYIRTLKVARTIADLAGSKSVLLAHALEALQMKPELPKI